MLFPQMQAIQYLFFICLSIPNVLSNSYRFICPKDGRWPHPSDCERYFTCNGSVAAEGWCGHGMTFDVDHERCELSKNIDCKYGERPNWKPPEGWQTESFTERIFVPTTTVTITSRAETETKSSTASSPSTTIFSTRLAHSRILSPLSNLIENAPCLFQGNMPDIVNCQSYFTCKDDVIVRLFCPDKHLFDEDLRSCNDYRKVFCGNRPSFEHANDSCFGQPNGWYADYGNQCRSYYLCTEQRKTKAGDCPIGSKWNVHRLRCDDPRYLAPPCGHRRNQANSLFGDRRRRSAKSSFIITWTLSFVYLLFNF